MIMGQGKKKNTMLLTARNKKVKEDAGPGEEGDSAAEGRPEGNEGRPSDDEEDGGDEEEPSDPQPEPPPFQFHAFQLFNLT